MKRFKNYEEAVQAFLENEGGSWDPFMSKHSQITSSLNAKMEHSPKYHARLLKWFDAASDLPTPWPEEHAQNLLRKKNGPYPEIFGWCKEENLLFLESILGMGISPVLFVPSAYSTLLGFAAYTENAPATNLLLQYCTIAQSRLLLTEKQLKDNDAMLYSTLLHRMCNRGFNQNMLKIVDIILEHDPDAILAKTKGGASVYKNASLSIRPALEQRYNERLAQLEAQRIHEHIEEKDFAVPNRRKI